jgi:hypothetical protein
VDGAQLGRPKCHEALQAVGGHAAAEALTPGVWSEMQASAELQKVLSEAMVPAAAAAK